MAAQAGLCLAWSETPEDTFSRDEAHMFKYIVATHYNPLHRNTVNFLNIRTPKKFVVITLKFELCGSTIE